MKYVKHFEEFNFRNLFKSKQGNEVSEDEKEISKIMIDCEPYDRSQFGQDKYGVYIQNNDTHYYIGDIREFTKSEETNPYISYLTIDRVIEKEPSGELCQPNIEQMDIIEEELDKSYLSPNLMDETITLREFLKEKGIL